jgi:hypothetical protein
MQNLITQTPGMGATAHSLGTPSVSAEGSATHNMAAVGAKPSAAAGGKKGAGGGKGQSGKAVNGQFLSKQQAKLLINDKC